MGLVSISQEPYKNWNTLEMMLALYRKTDALDYIKRQFMTVARMKRANTGRACGELKSPGNHFLKMKLVHVLTEAMNPLTM